LIVKGSLRVSRRQLFHGSIAIGTPIAPPQVRRPHDAHDAFGTAAFLSRCLHPGTENGFSALKVMDYTSSMQCGWVAIHFFGLIAAFLVRVYAGTAAESPLQAAFLMGLAGVAVATLAGEQFSWPLWTLSGATLSVMIVVAIADFRSPQHEQIG
jgi:hypothetical protein